MGMGLLGQGDEGRAVGTVALRTEPCMGTFLRSHLCGMGPLEIRRHGNGEGGT